MKALAIINLSTLDVYTDYFGEEKGAKFAHKLYEKIAEFDGPVYIVEQTIPPTKSSRPRLALKRSLISLMLKKDIHFIPFDENQTEWPYLLRDVLERLLEDGVKQVYLGGLWYDPDMEVGAVTEAYKYIRMVIPASIDPSISAQAPSGHPFYGESR